MKALLLFIALAFAVPAMAEPARVTVTRQGDSFVADFTFPTAAPAWGFWRSSTAASDNRSWRAKSWQVLTPGVTLQRRGQQDALIGANGRPVPRHVRVRLTPFTGDLNANYVPALRLGGDSVALFDGHFAVYSADLPTLDKLPPGFDPERAKVGDYGTAVLFKGKALRIAGDAAGYRKGESAGAYGLFGVPRATVANGVATVIDSELPKWIADDLATFTPRVMGAMAAPFATVARGTPNRPYAPALSPFR